MGYKELELTMPADYAYDDLVRKIGKLTGTTDFTFGIQKKSLDARKKGSIRWQMRVLVRSDRYKDPAPVQPELEIPRGKHDGKIVVVGSGPSGFFAAHVLQQAGYEVTLIERGADVDQRAAGIREFENGGDFAPEANYAFGEGGAGTFSDGKLTSRTKRISLERDYIFNTYIAAGAPPEIRYLTHPHLGTDNLTVMVKALRRGFTDMGGTILFNTRLTDLAIHSGEVKSIQTTVGSMDCRRLFIAPGHSAYETCRMLINRGIPFRVKNFAIGSRVEHQQEVINRAQWGRPALKGVKAAEYRLTSQGDGGHPVYTFCMCPGGTVVPAAAYAGQNIVNGMSRYLRDGQYANAACVAGISLEELLKRDVHPLEALDWLEKLEQAFYAAASGYRAPAARIRDFISGKLTGTPEPGSHPLGLHQYPLWELLPASISAALRQGLKEFSRKIQGFDGGTIMGLESKTSAPLQVAREKNGLVTGFTNLYIVGEGSGYAGGIVSSAADGIRAAMGLVKNPDS